jgi:hypothetical protein
MPNTAEQQDERRRRLPRPRDGVRQPAIELCGDDEDVFTDDVRVGEDPLLEVSFATLMGPGGSHELGTTSGGLPVVA